MTATIGQVLGNAVGVAISPLPVIALILMLLSHQALRNGASFAAGWLVGLSTAGTIVLVVGVASTGGAPFGGVLALVVGVVFLGMAWRQWSSRAGEGEEPVLPGWMTAIDGFGPGRSAATGFALSALNPKNLGLTIAAAAAIDGAGLGIGQEYVVLGTYVAIASTSVVLPVVAYAVLGDRATVALTSTRTWLASNHAVIMAVVLLVLGAKLVGDGLVALG